MLGEVMLPGSLGCRVPANIGNGLEVISETGHRNCYDREVLSYCLASYTTISIRRSLLNR